MVAMDEAKGKEAKTEKSEAMVGDTIIAPEISKALIEPFCAFLLGESLVISELSTIRVNAMQPYQ